MSMPAIEQLSLEEMPPPAAPPASPLLKPTIRDHFRNRPIKKRNKKTEADTEDKLRVKSNRMEARIDQL